MSDAPMPFPPAQRPWVVETTPGPVITQESDAPGWEEKVPDLDRQADINGIFLRGKERVDPAEVPDTVRLLKKSKRLPDGFKVYAAMLVVTGEVKAVIEELDPGRHQFVPIRVTERDGTPIEKDWHVLVITHRQDSLVPEQSELKYDGRSWGPTYYWLRGPEMVAFDPARLDDSHLWWEDMLKGGHALLMSHALREALKAKGLRMLRQKRSRKFGHTQADRSTAP